MTAENTTASNLENDSRQSKASPIKAWLCATALHKAKLWAMLAFLFLLPLQTRYIFRAAPLYEYGTLSVLAVELLGWVVIALGAIKMKNAKPRTELRSGTGEKLKIKNVWFLSLPILAFFSILWAPDKLVALQAAVRLLEGVLLCTTVSAAINYKLQITNHKQYSNSNDQNCKGWRFINWNFLGIWDLKFGIYTAAFLAGATLQAVLGIYQFLTQSSFASTLLGMAAHDPAALGTAVVEFSDERWLRAYGGLPHPNVLGGYLMVALVMLLHYLRHSEGVPRPRDDEESPTNVGSRIRAGSFAEFTPHRPIPIGLVRGLRMTPFFICFFVILTGIFFSFSRAAWVAVIVLLGYWVIKLLRRNSIGKKLTIVSFLPMLSLMGYIVFLIIWFYPLVNARVMSANQGRLETKSRVERVQGVREAWELIKQHPLMCVGMGNYTQAVARDLRPDQPLYAYQPVHNVFLLVLAELGLVGLLFFLAILYQILKHSKFYILHSTFYILLLLDHYLWTLPFGILLFWPILGLFADNPQDSS